MTDYYVLLEVSRTSSQEDIKKSYKRLVKTCHPDLCKDDKAPARFKEISEAYFVLGDAKRRSEYDAFNDFRRSPAGASFRNHWSSSTVFRGPGFAGFDVEGEIKVSFEDGITGTLVRKEIPDFSGCHDCGGHGRRLTEDSCQTCEGRGRTSFSVGIAVGTTSCRDCAGSGKSNVDCISCAGKGLLKGLKEVPVEVPPCVDPGTVITFPGRGGQSVPGGPRGDARVRVVVEDHPLFLRRGMNIYSVISIPYQQAILGKDVVIPTIRGDVNLKVPPLTRDGLVLRLRGGGVRMSSGKSGDHFVKVVIKFPTTLSQEEKELLRQIDGLT